MQVAALVATAAKFGTACETVERFRDFDGEVIPTVRSYEELEAENAALQVEIARLKAQAAAKEAASAVYESICGDDAWRRSISARRAAMSATANCVSHATGQA